MNISQVLTKLKALIYSKSETDSLLGGKANSSHTHTKSQITDFPSLATVATSGSYSDLSNKPTIPSNTNQLTNGAGYITSSGSCNYANSAGSAGSASSATYAGYVKGNRATGTYVNEVKYGNALVTTNYTGFGAIFNAPTKNYRVACATYPNHDDNLIFYSVTNDNVSSSTNVTNKTMTWNGDTGILSATRFSGPLTGNVTGNCSGSAGSVAWSNVSSRPYMVDFLFKKTIDGNFSTQYRTQTRGNTTQDAYLSVIRTSTTGVAKCPAYGSGIASGMGDTHFYIYCSYSEADAYIGGGNGDKLNWISRINVEDNTYLNGYKIYVG